MNPFQKADDHGQFRKNKPTKFERNQNLQPSSIYTSVGDADLDPLKASPGINPFLNGDFNNGEIHPGSGMHPGGGMIVGPEHPMFTQAFKSRNGNLGGSNHPTRGDIPAGARFDPVMPFGPGSSANYGQVPRNRHTNRTFRYIVLISGDPDNDDFLPPGNDDYI